MSETEIKVVVAHPGKQHSFQTAIALEKKGFLFKYITTIYNTKHSLTNLLTHFLKGNIAKKSKSRYCKEISDNNVVQFCEVRSLINLFISKLKLPNQFKAWYNDRLADSFGRKVAKFAIKNKVDIVIMYDCTATKCFEILKKKAPTIKCVLDTTILHRAYMKRIYERDIEETKSYELKETNHFLWDKKNMSNYIKEAKLADYLLVPSAIVEKSLCYIDVPKEKILKIPYGVDIKQFSLKKQKASLNEPLKLIYVGQINYRKGLHHLLPIISKLPDLCQIDLIGSYDPESKIYKNYCRFKNINFRGFITRDILPQYFQKADVFVLPSLAEGLALVGLEAMASGLPLLCSENTGVNDLIVNGVTGFTYPVRNIEKLEEFLLYFASHKDICFSMGKQARKVAENYTWDNYQRNLCTEMEKIIGRDSNE